jgi:hypothetical protein
VRSARHIHIGVLRRKKSIYEAALLLEEGLTCINTFLMNAPSLNDDSWETLLGCRSKGGAGQAIEGLGWVLLFFSKSFKLVLGRLSRCSKREVSRANKKEAT